jgi:hypothetical protein
VSAYSGGSGHDIFGNPLDIQPLAAEFRHLFPDTARQAPGGQVQKKRTLVYPPKPKGKKKRGKPKVAK